MYDLDPSTAASVNAPVKTMAPKATTATQPATAKIVCAGVQQLRLVPSHMPPGAHVKTRASDSMTGRNNIVVDKCTMDRRACHDTSVPHGGTTGRCTQAFYSNLVKFRSQVPVVPPQLRLAIVVVQHVGTPPTPLAVLTLTGKEVENCARVYDRPTTIAKAPTANSQHHATTKQATPKLVGMSNSDSAGSVFTTGAMRGSPIHGEPVIVFNGKASICRPPDKAHTVSERATGCGVQRSKVV